MASIGTTEVQTKLDFDLVYGLFLAFLLAATYLLLDPFYMGHGLYRTTRDPGPIKYFPLFIATGASVLALFGHRLFRSGAPQAIYLTLKRGWPILALGAVILSGSLYYRFILGFKATFLPAGIGVLGYPIAVVIFYSVKNPYRLLSSFFWALLIVSPYEISWIILQRMKGGQAFHLEIFLIIPLAVYFFRHGRSRFISWTVLLCMVATGLLTDKYTGYATLLMTILYLAAPRLTQLLTQKDVTLRLVFTYVTAVSIAVFGAFLLYLFVHREQYLPSGDVPLRLQTYFAAWQSFLSSPLYGDGYIGTPLRSLVGFTVAGSRLILTHSDFLDILSHGGLLGMSLYLYGFYRLMRPALSQYFSTAAPMEIAHIGGLLAIVTCGIFVMLFNPLMMAIQVSSLFWMALGFLGAVTTDMERSNFSKNWG